MRVNDSSILLVNGGVYGLDIAADSSGKFIVCWGAKPSLEVHSRIYFQRYDSSGNRTGTLQIANEANSRAQFPELAMNLDGSFIICWQDDRYSYPNKYDIFMQRYNSIGVKIGNNVKVNDDTDTLVNQLGPVISSNGKSCFVIAWSDERNSENNIYYQLYDSNGTAIGSNRKATIYSSIGNSGLPQVTMREDRKFFIGWSDRNYASREQFYGRRFNSNGDPIGLPYMIPMSSPLLSTQRLNTVLILGDRVYAAWQDTRNDDGDIYCNVRGFQNPDTVIGIKVNSNELPFTFELYQNYPNPFNPVTKIKFQVSKLSHVKLIAYDVLGMEVTQLVNEKLMPGIYDVEWNAGNFSSGVYFYRIEAGSFVDTKKMVLVK